MIDRKDTKRFKAFSNKILDPKKRDEVFLNSLRVQQTEVQRDLQRIKNEAAKMGEVISKYFSSMSKTEASLLRTGEYYSGDTSNILFKRIEKMTLQVLSEHSNITHKKSHEEFYNSYLFRSCVCFYFVAQEWHLNGGLNSVKSKTMMNDMLDMQIVAYATYFDGLLSNDKKAKRMYEISNHFIKSTIAA